MFVPSVSRKQEDSNKLKKLSTTDIVLVTIEADSVVGCD